MARSRPTLALWWLLAPSRAANPSVFSGIRYCALRRNYIVEHAGPLMVRAYLSERATGGAVASSPRRGGLGGVNVSFSSFLCAKEKDRTLQGLALHKGDVSTTLDMTEGV